MTDEVPQKGLIYVLDMESTLADHLIRRIVDMNQYMIFRKWDMKVDPQAEIEAYREELRGIIISGSSKNINSKKYIPPEIPPEILQAGFPVLGICYGMQAIGSMIGTPIVRCWGQTDKKKRNKPQKDPGEQGPTFLNLTEEGRQSILFRHIGGTFPVWMKHNWMVGELPQGWTRTAFTDKCPLAAMESGNVFAVQFHPEPYNSLFGRTILHNFLTYACQVRTPYF